MFEKINIFWLSFILVFLNFSAAQAVNTNFVSSPTIGTGASINFTPSGSINGANYIFGTSKLDSAGASYFMGGNVGIGTTNPGSYKLNVVGNSNFTGGVVVDTPTNYSATVVTSLTSAPIQVPIVNIGTTPSFLPFLNQNALYSSGFITHMSLGLYKGINGWGAGDNGFYVALGGSDSYPTEYYKMTYGGNIVNSGAIGLVAGGTNQNVVLTPSGTGYTLLNGNVGIGTTTPGKLLEVNGQAKFNNFAYGTTPASTDILALSTVEYVNGKTGGSGGVGTGTSGQTLRHNGTGWIANSTLFNDGTNVGIGTTNPFAKLEINGALKFGDTADTCDANHTGALRYNSTSGQSYLCDGSRWLNQKNCGLMTDDVGQTYGTVQIGGQCWMAENINIGTMLAAGTTEPVTTDNIIEKWCYLNLTSNCAAQGGLYNWNEATRGSQVAGARGICPSGWHIPTDAEYNTLEKTVLGLIASPNVQYACNMSVSGWQRCADNSGTDTGGTYGAGKSLKSVGVGSGVGAGNDLAGFNGKLSGARNTVGSYYNLGWVLYLWSSTPSGPSNAWGRALYSPYSTVYRLYNARAYGFSVRCLRD